MLTLLLVIHAAAPPAAMLRQVVAETAVAQAKKIDPAWHPDQRDCAGLIRFSYRAAYKKFRPERLAEGLWRGHKNEPLAFADAETLLAHSFKRIGRDSKTARLLQSGDVVAFRQRDNTYHLMLVVRTDGPASGDSLVVYHPGNATDEIRIGALRSLAEEAPHEWRPTADNGAFLGFYRFEEWAQ